MAYAVPYDSCFKDESLGRLAASVNVAQFVSFEPAGTPRQRFCHIRGHTPNRRFTSPEEAIRAVLKSSVEHSVNIRSFRPDQPSGQPFIYGVKEVEAALGHVRRLGGDGLYTIVNETIDVHDGGVSGVLYGGVVEFAPDDTPRCVEEPGVASLPAVYGVQLLTTVYGFIPALDYPKNIRVEFSIHPRRRGVRHEHTVIWEMDELPAESLSVEISWPNRFSRFLGDKAFGLLVAELAGAAVPATTVVTRRVPPFRFGRSTGTGETWTRTCPVEQVAGFFTTQFGWVDPFQLLADDDRTGSNIPSVLAQEAVDSQYSGASGIVKDGALLIEGVVGRGDPFMKGLVPPGDIPEDVKAAVAEVHSKLGGLLGDIRLEWVYDGTTAWVVQLHRGRTEINGWTIFPGQPEVFHRFEVGRGLESLREFVAKLDSSREGVILVGNVGRTSHLGDILRRARVASRIEPQGTT